MIPMKDLATKYLAGHMDVIKVKNLMSFQGNPILLEIFKASSSMTFQPQHE